MQDRRQLCFILGLVGAIFSLGSGVMTLLMSVFVLGMLPVPMADAPIAVFVGLFAWLALTAIVGGGIMLAGSLRLRGAVGAPARSAAILTIVGGCIVILGGNLLGAGLGIAAGAITLSDASQAQASA